jgi:hypothetical protein
MARKPSGLHLVGREYLLDEAVEIRDPLVRQGVRPYRWIVIGFCLWILIDFHDLRVVIAVGRSAPKLEA